MHVRRSRHAFLSGGLAAAAATLVAGPPHGARAASGAERAAPTIAIVGAGISGLSAALVLHDHGIRATVYEARTRTGGRIHSERALWGDGQVSEYGGELIDTSHTTMQALAKRFGLHLTDLLAAEVDGSEQTIFLRGAYYPEKRLFHDFKAVYPTLAAQLAATGPGMTYARSTAAGRELDKINLNQWITRFVPGGLRSDLGQFILLQYVAEYGIEPERQSSLDMIYWLGNQPAYDKQTGEFVALGPSDQRFHVGEGNDRIPSAIAATLPPGSVRLRHRLESLRRRSDGRIALAFATPDGPREVVADQAIVTVPFIVLRALDLSRADFDARKMLAINELGYGNHSKLTVQFEERYWSKRGAWPATSTGDTTYDGAFMQTYDISRGQAGSRGLLVNFAPTTQSLALGAAGPYGTSATDPLVARDARTFVAQLERVFPGAARHASGRAALSHYVADPFALGSYSGWLVGQYTKFAGYERVRQGNVHFAGEHCSVLLQGFMEGAAREGARAAREVLADVGAPARP